jgi:hypothetical protein
MTREEAINELKELKEDYWDDDGYGHETKQYDDTMAALDMAISALEQQDILFKTGFLKDCESCKVLEQQPCEDAISKQTAIDIVRHECGEWKGLAKEIVKQFNGLSPVQPKPKTGHWIDDEFGSKCSWCGIHTHLDKFDKPMKLKYCSMCGAKMVEPQESEVQDAVSD